MQRLTRYPLLIRQILQYTDPPATTNTIQTKANANPPTISLQLPGDAKERQDISAALDAAEKILEHVNETIREQEGRERLREISKDLWIGQGYVVVVSWFLGFAESSFLVVLISRRQHVTWDHENF